MSDAPALRTTRSVRAGLLETESIRLIITGGAVISLMLAGLCYFLLGPLWTVAAPFLGVGLVVALRRLPYRAAADGTELRLYPDRIEAEQHSPWDRRTVRDATLRYDEIDIAALDALNAAEAVEGIDSVADLGEAEHDELGAIGGFEGGVGGADAGGE